MLLIRKKLELKFHKCMSNLIKSSTLELKFPESSLEKDTWAYAGVCYIIQAIGRLSFEDDFYCVSQ